MHRRDASSAVVAAIDLGTNAFRLLIAEVDASLQLTARQTLRVIPRLGEGVGRTGRLTGAAVERAVAALKDIQSVVGRHRVDAVVAVATSAVREAANGREFLERVKIETGLEVEVISGDEEARKTWLGVRAGCIRSERAITDAVVVDIGGGSTEVISVRGGEFERAISLDLGVVKLTEQCVHHDPPLEPELRELDMAARRGLHGAAALASAGPRAVIGTAGTVTSAAVLHLGLAWYEPALIHDRTIPTAAILDLASRLARMTAEERRRLPSLERGREDVILAGLFILNGVLDLFGSDHLRVSEYGLREGLVVEWAQRHLSGKGSGQA